MDTVTEKKWNDAAQKSLAGKKIVKAAYMTKKEATAHGWYSRPVMFTLDDGSVFYASSDDEGNNGGALFGMDAKGEDLSLPVLR